MTDQTNGNRFSRLTDAELRALRTALIHRLSEQGDDAPTAGALSREIEREQLRRAGSPPDFSQLPDLHSLEAYINTGRPLGGFLTAIVTNDLVAATRRADLRNRPMIPLYAQYLEEKAPAACYGSADAYREWRERGGLQGRD